LIPDALVELECDTAVAELLTAFLPDTVDALLCDTAVAAPERPLAPVAVAALVWLAVAVFSPPL
jgi:hypothetical protein